MWGPIAANTRPNTIPPYGKRAARFAGTGLLAVHEFVKKLAHLDLGSLQRLPSRGSGTVDLAQRPAIALLRGTEIALLLQPVEQRIQTARADAVAVPPQFFDHAEPENGLLRGVMQDVQADQPGVKIAVGRQVLRIGLRFRHTTLCDPSIGTEIAACQARE